MIKNFLLATLRNLTKNVLYTTINVSGLAIGIACSVLILLWVDDEATYDRFVPKSDRLYQVYVNAEFDHKINTWRSVPLPTYYAMKNDHSAIVNSTVAGWGNDRLISYEDTRITPAGYYVGEEFLHMFEYPAVEGDIYTSMDDPSSIVITESLSKKLFGEESAIGKVVKVENQSSLQVTAVLQDLPGNSSFQFEYLIPWKQREKVNPWILENKDNWGNYSFQIYVELDSPDKEPAVEASIASMLADNGQDDLPRSFFLHPMTRWRLHSQFEDGKESGGQVEYIRLFSFIAVFILIIACINFMNLATARSEKRAREVGIRKSLGSTRIHLILQFLGESILISLISFVIAIILAEVGLPFFNSMVEKELVIDFSQVKFWIFAAIMILGTGLMSGSYPAFYLSAFNPVTTLKGSVKVGKSASLPRKVLVVLQFFFSILLMTSTVVIYQQIDLVRDRELGYDQEHLISVEITDDIRENYKPLKNELLQTGIVQSVTKSNSMITTINSNNFLGWPGKPDDLSVLFTTIVADYDYARTMGIKMLHGRDFSEEFSTDTTAIVINKTALDLMGLEEPIGTNLELWGEQKRLVGVMDNVLMGSLYQEVKPMFMIIGDWGGFVSLRLNPGAGLQESLGQLETVFNKHNPAYPFEYKFADVEFQRKFSLINLTQKLSMLFSLLAIFITGLGLYGLASFMAEQRTKEIGIRKVLGASITSLIALISKDFSKLVLISFAIVVPFSWYGLDQYLDKYPIRIEIEWWIFPLVGLLALVFSLLIVSNQANRAAKANPVKSLRQE